MFGTFEVIANGQRLEPLESARYQRFFASVLLRDAVRQRARLAFDLWPDSTERQARTNLRKLLHDLRRLMPDIGAYFEIGNDSVRWKHSPESAVDVLAFRNALSAGDFGRAALLYAGDLLPNCYDDWILVEREGIERQSVDVRHVCGDALLDRLCQQREEVLFDIHDAAGIRLGRKVVSSDHTRPFRGPTGN